MPVNWDDFTPVSEPQSKTVDWSKFKPLDSGEVDWSKFSPVEQTKTATAPSPPVQDQITSDVPEVEIPHSALGVSTTEGGPQLRIAGAPGTGANLGRQIQEGLTAPIVDVAGALPRLRSPIPFHPLTGAGAAASGVIEGADELIEGVANFLTSPSGIVQVSALKTPLAPAVALKWAKDMVEGGMISGGEAYDAYKRGDTSEFSKHVTLGVGMLLGASGIVHGGLKATERAVVGLSPRGTGISQELTQLAPETAQAVTETVKADPTIKQSLTVDIASLTPATDKAVTESPSQNNKGSEPVPGQPLESSSGGPAPETGVSETGGGMSTKTQAEQARHESARLETEANLRKELEGDEFESGGPGAAATGQPGTYDPASELSDALKTIKEKDPLTRAQVSEKIADVWEAGKTAVQKAWGRVIAAKESIRSSLLEQDEVTPLKRLVSALDFQIQKSSAMSRELGKSFDNSHSKTRRNGIAVFVDSGMDAAKVKAAIAQLPANTPRRIRKAFEAAENLTPEEIDTAERIKHYFDQRLQDAQQAGVLREFLEDYYTHVWKRPERMPDELKNAMSNGRVVSYFENARERKLDDFITGVKLGLEPVLDPALVLPRYNFNLDRAIASRAFVKKLSETTEADGRPSVAPTGIGKQVVSGGNPATIIKPNVKSGEAADYKPVDNPALRKWKWAANAPDGTPIMIEGDLVVHPDAAQRIKNIMERERLTAGKTMRVLIRAGAEVKGAKLGILSPFHQIHVGSHAIWHLVNPFNLKTEIDWTHPATQFAVEKGGLKLAADFHDKMAFSEGVGPGLIAQKLVPYSRAYSEYLFESFIPRLKLKTFEAVYQRNLKRYQGKLTPEQIAARAGDAVNNAYGELNRLWLGKDGRDPRIQRAAQVLLLAPDFLEARVRFVAKALTKHGGEERMALFVMGASMYVTARVLNQLLDGDPHTEPGMMFSVRHNGVNYSIRSVIGDTEHLFTDWRSFVSHRINPLTTRTGVEIISGRDLRTGESRTTLEQAQDALAQIRPSQIDSMFANDREWYDGLVQSVGVTKRHQPTPEEIAKKKAKEEKEKIKPSKVEIIYKKDYRTPRK